MAEVMILGGRNYRLHHRAVDRGYIKVNDVKIDDYNGRFGKGVTIRCHLYGYDGGHVTTSHTVEYWIEED